MHVSMGTRIYISQQVPENTEKVVSYESLHYLQIRGIRNGGELIEQHETVTRRPISLSYAYQESVGEVLPSISWEVIKLPTDAGQQLLYEAFRQGVHAFCIRYTDGAKRFFVAKVRTRTDMIVDQSTMRGYRYELDLQSPIVDKR